MESNDITIEILRGIRDEVRGTNVRVDGLRDEIRETNARIDGLRDETHEGFGALNRRMVESEMRTATAITELTGTVRDMTAVLRAHHDLRPRLERCERDIDELKRRVTG